jgi:hypothetical protein
MMNATAIEIILKLLILIEYAAKVMGWRWRKGGDVEWRSLDIPIEGTGLSRQKVVLGNCVMK